MRCALIAAILAIATRARAEDHHHLHAVHDPDGDGKPGSAGHGPYDGKHEHHLYGLHDACEHEIADPVPTPLHDAGIDDQRAACLRTEFGANITTHALVDTPNFHGFIGGELVIEARHVVRRRFEFGARARLFDYGFVQTAVNKVSETRYGPLLISAAYGSKLSQSARFALVFAFEAPFTRNEMETRRTGAELTALVTGALTDRWTVHGRLGAVGALASSEAGSQQRLALRGGLDFAWRSRHNRVGLITGVETQAGFTEAIDTVMAREQFQLHVGREYRVIAALGLRLMGNDPTNAIFVLGLAREL
jgi:hypothetical protein